LNDTGDCDPDDDDDRDDRDGDDDREDGEDDRDGDDDREDGEDDGDEGGGGEDGEDDGEDGEDDGDEDSDGDGEDGEDDGDEDSDGDGEGGGGNKDGEDEGCDDNTPPSDNPPSNPPTDNPSSNPPMENPPSNPPTDNPPSNPPADNPPAQTRTSDGGTPASDGTTPLASLAAAVQPAQGKRATARSRARLTVDKSGPRFAVAGQVVTYRIKVSNRGGTAARRVVFSDVLPGGFSVAARAKGARVSAGRVTWTVGSLRPGASRVVSVKLRLDRDLAGRRCNIALAKAANAIRVRDLACTRIRAIAGAITPAVTG
jgi:uncharacterized repeat protein (TIGR01451 family)